MLYIQHRVNSSDDLKSLDRDWGCEIDLRSDVTRPDEIILSHDPWHRGESFEEWLKVYASLGMKGPLILNTKEDGLESRILKLIEAYAIDSWFFLDTALPTLVAWTTKPLCRRFAIRVSQFESVEQALTFAGRAEWVWADCFDAKPLPHSAIERLKGAFRICLVSPELQKGALQAIDDFSSLWPFADAVCTKSPKTWQTASAHWEPQYGKA
jgi:hypothetical protein